jgi:hypothetical protein
VAVLIARRRLRVSLPLVKYCFKARNAHRRSGVRQKYFYTIMMFAVT